MDFDQTLYIVIPLPTELRRGYSNATVRPSVRASVCPSVTFLVNTRVNMVQWISTKLGTQVIVTKLWHPIDFNNILFIGIWSFQIKLKPQSSNVDFVYDIDLNFKGRVSCIFSISLYIICDNLFESVSKLFQNKIILQWKSS
jgi:hypothetical protein